MYRGAESAATMSPAPPLSSGCTVLYSAVQCCTVQYTAVHCRQGLTITLNLSQPRGEQLHYQLVATANGRLPSNELIRPNLLDRHHDLFTGEKK